MACDKSYKLGTRLVQFDLLPKLKLGSDAVLEGRNHFFTVGDLLPEASERLLPFLCLRFDNVLVIHETKQELFKSVTLILEFVQLV